MLIIVVLFITLANLKQLIYWKILYLLIVGIYVKYCLKFHSTQDRCQCLLKTTKATNTYHSTIQFLPGCYKTQEMCDKAVNRCYFWRSFCASILPDRYNKTQAIFDEIVSDCLAVLKFTPDWFVTSERIEKLLIALYEDDNVLYFNILVTSYFLVMKWLFLV